VPCITVLNQVFSLQALNYRLIINDKVECLGNKRPWSILRLFSSTCQYALKEIMGNYIKSKSFGLWLRVPLWHDSNVSKDHAASTSLHTDDGGNMYPWNFGILPQRHTESQPKNNERNLIQDIQSPVWVSNLTPSEYEAGLLSTTERCSGGICYWRLLRSNPGTVPKFWLMGYNNTHTH
jgi:hypothetical protein